MSGLMPASEALAGLVSRIGKIGAWLFVPLMLVIMFDVITRKFGFLSDLREHFAQSGQTGAVQFMDGYFTSTKFQELEWHLHAALFLLCLGYAYVHNSHVRIELIREKFSRRTKAWEEVVLCFVFLLPYAGLVLYYGLNFTHRSYAMDEVSSALTGLGHRWIIKSFVPIGMAILLVAGAAVVLRNLAFLFGDEAEKKRAVREARELHDPTEELIKEVVGEEIAP